jgi:ribonuclease PH
MRVDREITSLRALSIDIGLVNEASGSARFRMGRTVATSVVLGPSVPKYSRHEEYRSMTVEVVYNTSLGGGSGAGDSALGAGHELKRAEREGARFIRSGLLGAIDVTRCPRTLLVVKVTVDFDDGNAICTGFNAGVMALMNAGIRMNYIPLAVGVAYLRAENSLAATVFSSSVEASQSSKSSTTIQKTEDGRVTLLCVDPIKDEEDQALSKFHFVLRVSPSTIGADSTGSSSNDNSNSQKRTLVVHTRCKGTFSDERLQEALKLAASSAVKISTFMKSVEF